MSERVAPIAVVSGALHGYVNHWPLAILSLGLIPFGWAEILNRPLGAFLEPYTKLPSVFLDGLLFLWASLLLAPQLALALALIRNRSGHWQTILRSFRRVPRTSAALMLLMSPYLMGSLCIELANLQSFKSFAIMLSTAGILCFTGAAFVCFRCIAFVPLVAHRNIKIFAALHLAWQSTRSSAKWLLGIAAWSMPVLIVATAATVVFPRVGLVVWLFATPWLTLVWAGLYTELMHSWPPPPHSPTNPNP